MDEQGSNRAFLQLDGNLTTLPYRPAANNGGVNNSLERETFCRTATLTYLDIESNLLRSRSCRSSIEEEHVCIRHEMYPWTMRQRNRFTAESRSSLLIIAQVLRVELSSITDIARVALYTTSVSCFIVLPSRHEIYMCPLNERREAIRALLTPRWLRVSRLPPP